MTTRKITLNDLITAIETDHGVPQAFSAWATLGDYFNGVGSACALGNAAIHVLKHDGTDSPIDENNLVSLGGSLDTGLSDWVAGIVDELDIPSDEIDMFVNNLTPIDLNDERNLSFSQIASTMRSTLEKYKIDLNTPIEYNWK